jgi:ribosome-binding factor A
VRVLGTDVNEAGRKATIDALYRAGGYIRRELAPRLQLKYHPELKFFWDDNVDRALRIEALLHEVATSDAESGESNAAAKPVREASPSEAKSGDESGGSKGGMQ